MTAAAGPRGAVLPLGIVAAAGAAAVVVQQVFNPFVQDIPLCPIHALTGLNCGGCGATRAVHALLEGDLALAAQNNVMIVLGLPFALLLLADWTRARVRGVDMRWLPSNGMLIALAVIALMFTVLRNLPMFWFLAPT